MSNAVLSMRQITRQFEQAGSVLNVLNGIALEIQPGEVVALVGPSGSGKTTLLQIAGLLDTPTSGDIFIGDKNMSKASDKKRTLMRRGNIGFIYQFHHLLAEFSALENVIMPQMISGKNEDEAKNKAADLLASLGLESRFSHRPAKLSGGEQQRVAIARALANNPQLLLADEPTGNLDSNTAEEVFAMLLKLAKEQNTGALIATHNLDLAKRMDRIVCLEEGTLR